jgi:hypothetical protein
MLMPTLSVTAVGVVIGHAAAVAGAVAATARRRAAPA